MTASTPPGPASVWPTDPRARRLAIELYDSVADRPLVSVHNGLPARYLAEDLPVTDPLGLLIAHDQGIYALLRVHGIRTEFGTLDGWGPEEASRQAFVLMWRRMVDVRSRGWAEQDIDDSAEVAGLPPLRADEDPLQVYDRLAEELHVTPIYPRQVLAAANIARLGTSDDFADDLGAHDVLADDPTWAGRVVPTFSPDRILDPGRRAWRTDADLLAEITGIGTEDLAGFLEALRRRRAYFLSRGALATEHHSSDIAVARLPARDAERLYRLARSAELLSAETLSLQGHLLWEMGQMSAADGLVMRLYPPAGFRAGSAEPAEGTDDRGIADRLRPLLADFGSSPRFRLSLFSIDADAYLAEIVPLAVAHPAVTAVPPTRFADDPARLRTVRAAAVRALGSARCLGVVDDMSGPLVLPVRHRLGHRLDAGALAELVHAGHFTVERAGAELRSAVESSAT